MVVNVIQAAAEPGENPGSLIPSLMLFLGRGREEEAKRGVVGYFFLSGERRMNFSVLLRLVFFGHLLGMCHFWLLRFQHSRLLSPERGGSVVFLESSA